MYIVLDYETRSEVDLKTVGAYEYARHPTTQILCVAWQLLNKAKIPISPIKIWSPYLNESFPPFDLISNENIFLVAHNSFFEQLITKFVLTKYFNESFLKNIPVDKWICTASMAAALALPRSLEGACDALKLPHKKDMEGRRLILKYCKPRKATKNNAAKFHNKLADLKRITEYCKNDIRAEVALFRALPELSPQERRLWLLDQKMNHRGFKIDEYLVTKALSLIEKETEKLNSETFDLTQGAVFSVNQRNETLAFVNRKGYSLPDLTANTVKTAVASLPLDPVSHRLLTIRHEIAKTSTAKYAAFKARSGTGNRVRDFQLYHGASTGRWTGTGVQPQNFPRGEIKNTDLASQILKEYDAGMLRLLYGNPLTVASSCLRAVIQATPGYELFCADYSAIEARVLLWVSEDTAGLDVFNKGLDPYKVMAAAIYNKNIEDVTKSERELGKRAELACGYGMGVNKFLETCKSFGGVEVSEDLAKKAVDMYRKVHNPVVKLWRDMENAAIYAVKTKKIFEVGRTKWFLEGDFLFCELPSKRRLAYHQPEIQQEKTPWGELRSKIYHWGANPITKQWVRDATIGCRLVENVVQAIARDIMAEAMLRIDAAGFDVLLSVHDEILSEKKRHTASLQRYEFLMRECPEWGRDIPLKVEGWIGDRYRK